MRPHRVSSEVGAVAALRREFSVPVWIHPDARAMLAAAPASAARWNLALEAPGEPDADLPVGDFEAAGVAIDYVDYSCTPWPQGPGEFTPYVSILDLIARTGRDAAQYLQPRTLPWRAFLDRKGIAA